MLRMNHERSQKKSEPQMGFIGNFQAIFALSNNFDRKKVFCAPGMKVSNNIQKFIGRPAASRHVMHVILRACCFFREISTIRGFISQNVETVPEFSVSFLYFWQALILLSLRFKYLVSVLDLSVNQEIKREICLFLSSFSESETISC